MAMNVQKTVTLETGNKNIPGYMGKVLRINLTKTESRIDELESSFLRKYIGGATLGIKYLYDEVPPDVGWPDPENRIFIGTGPLGGTRVGGSGSITVVTKGALTNGIASTQANGYFGAFLRFSGFYAIILEGAASAWTYLYIHDGTVEFRDAGHLAGKNTLDIDTAIKKELNKGERKVSILSIGPAGENLVKFACILTDLGHAAAHNGVGAVLGSKKIKAIVVERGQRTVPVYDKEALTKAAKAILDNTLAGPYGHTAFIEGTVGMIPTGTKVFRNVPVKNYTTNVNTMTDAVLDTYTCQNIRSKFKAKPNPCWACTAKHCHMMEIDEGKYKGRVFEEPEYEGMAACSTAVGVEDVTMTVVLASEIDRLGLDANESGWVMAWAIECYEKGLLTLKDTDGLELTWGNGEALMSLLNKIAHREGFGNILAEGVMRAAQRVGGKAMELAIHTIKGNTPRGHDHRVVWFEQFDTIVSNTGTLETQLMAPYKLLGLPMDYDKFDPEAVSTMVAKTKGAMLFEDSMVTCRYNSSTAIDLLCQAVNAATGWDLDVTEAMAVGKRAANMARAFNLRHGIGTELDAPSPRYGSTLTDGPSVGKGIMPHLGQMLNNYYRQMGWDENSGKPLPKTLSALGLDFIIPDLWKQ
jgi:aldehyde:ferredoxin oxidoreductase